ncbi:MAG: polysaccharide biosynthesis protein [Oscillospiraceae bacterium]|nr:polysaccharide biosynthesis protein [Oscillospiraceae bacterium]
MAVKLKTGKLNFMVIVRQILLLAMDVVIINLSTFFMYGMYLGFQMGDIIPTLLGRAIPVTAGYIVLYWALGLYNSMWKYAGMYELIHCTLAGSAGSFLSVGIDYMGARFGVLNMELLPPTVYLSSMLMILALCGSMRLAYRFGRRAIREGTLIAISQGKSHGRVMLVGAGNMGMIVVRELAADGYTMGRPVVIVDDDVSKQGQRLSGIPIRGGCDKIPKIAAKYRVNEIILCIPSADRNRQLEIMKIAMQTGCVLKTSPSLLEMASMSFELKSIRNVDIADLLSRPEVDLDTEHCRYLNGNTVMVTGCGSIGSELCRQVCKHGPKRLIIVDNYENNAYNTYNELQAIYKDSFPIYIRIGSVQDSERMRGIFAEFRPDIVFHAAAHKHVPLMEDNPCEAVKNNIFGTYNTAKAAMEHRVKKFIILSTDKAVNPANVMGATKRVTELIIQYLNRKTGDTDFAAVRFGNVLGSNGSVIPLFKEQLERGGPLTVTDPGITRYFMTISEAAQLVVQAGSLSEGGEVFVLDMGEPVKILTLAENYIKLSGYMPYRDIDIVFTGLRPGEKLFEELALPDEISGRRMTANNKIYVTPPVEFDDAALESSLDKLRKASAETVRECLREIVPNFQ